MEQLYAFAIAAVVVVSIFGVSILHFLHRLVDKIENSNDASIKLGEQMRSAIETIGCLARTLESHADRLGGLEVEMARLDSGKKLLKTTKTKEHENGN